MLNIFSPKQAKQAARSLERFMKAKGYALKLGEALEALAQMSGNKNWAALAQNLDEVLVNRDLSPVELQHIFESQDDANYGQEYALVAHTGFELRYPQGAQDLDYVRVCDPLGRETAYWAAEELQDASVMGAVVGALVRGRPVVVGEKAPAPKNTSSRQKPEAPRPEYSEASAKLMLDALENLLPYVQRYDQPGERWPTLCIEQTLAAVRAGRKDPVIQDVNFFEVSAVMLNGDYYRLQYHDSEEVARLQHPLEEGADPEEVECVQALGLGREEDGLVFDESVELATLRRLAWDGATKMFVDPQTQDTYQFILARPFGT